MPRRARARTPVPSSKSRRSRRAAPIRNDPRVQHFFELAAAYCELIETVTISKRTFLRRCADLLPALLSAAIRLPAGRLIPRIQREQLWIMEDMNECGFLKPERREIAKSSPYRCTVISTKDWFRVQRRLSKRLANVNYYHEIFDPFKDLHPIGMSLSTDLADVWRDVKQAILLYSAGGVARHHAVYEAAWAVRSHWGIYHAADAIKAIFFALKQVDEKWQDLDDKQFPPRKTRR